MLAIELLSDCEAKNQHRSHNMEQHPKQQKLNVNKHIMSVKTTFSCLMVFNIKLVPTKHPKLKTIKLEHAELCSDGGLTIALCLLRAQLCHSQKEGVISSLL